MDFKTIEFLRYLIVQEVMNCPDENLLDLVDKILIAEGGVRV